MFSIFQQEIVISALMGLFLVFSILTRLFLGLLYRRMIKETDNMASTDNKLLKQCKLKFTNCFQLNNGVANIPVFVDKFMNRLMVGKFSFDGIYHLSGQLVLLSVTCAGIGVCKSIAGGRSLGDIMPFYIVCFLGLYVYFSVSAAVDIKGKRRTLKVNLVDYLENHLSSRMDVTDQDIQMLYGREWVEKEPHSAPKKKVRAVASRKSKEAERPEFTKEQEKELEELLMDFLTS